MKRHHLVISLVLTLLLVGNATALELGSRPTVDKIPNQPGHNPGTPDGREGGEDMATAVPILALPFFDTGNTSDNINDYDPACPYDGSTSPDVVYSYTPQTDEVVSLDLCGSGYDTNLAVYDDAMNIVACNDDYYNDPECGQYVSFIEVAELQAGQIYFIVVDGYGGDSGDYQLQVNYIAIPPPCDLPCSGVAELEPPLVDGYVDEFNSGCGGETVPIQELTGDAAGELVFCGQSGWYLGSFDEEFRDTDWFLAVIGSTGEISWTLDAEAEAYGFLLGPQNCDAVGVVEQMTAGPCAPVSMTITGEPGQVVWLWVGPTEFTPPYGFEGTEFGYVSTFTGLAAGVVATDRTTFGGIKSIYR